jgi:hypothetical protein
VREVPNWPAFYKQTDGLEHVQQQVGVIDRVLQRIWHAAETGGVGVDRMEAGISAHT